jgi:hypothetical protein
MDKKSIVLTENHAKDTDRYFTKLDALMTRELRKKCAQPFCNQGNTN